MLHKQHQQVEDLWLEPDDLAVGPELVPLRVDLGSCEPILHSTPKGDLSGTHERQETGQRQGHDNAFSRPPQSVRLPTRVLYSRIETGGNWTLESRS